MSRGILSQPTGPKRPYNSTRRRAQADETRRQVVETAFRLFRERGYAGATIEAIAQEAGVAPETIYAVFGNKRTILMRLVEISVGGDDEAIPLLQRPGPQKALHELDPQRQLQLFAQDIEGILQRVAPIFEIMRLAAKTEPDIADLLNNLLEERLENLGLFVRSLSAHTPLREGLDEAHAAEIVWTITSPEVFNLLIVGRGWSREQYIRWLADTINRLLLP
jgi:AcrR family transcriptional regulator